MPVSRLAAGTPVTSLPPMSTWPAVGEVELVIDGTTYNLKQGDSFAFKSTLLHAFRNNGAVKCEIIWVNTTKPSEVRDDA